MLIIRSLGILFLRPFSMNNIPILEPFDCEGEPSSLGSRWERLKRGFKMYLEAANITDPVKKRATILHAAGLTLQDVFFNIPGALVEESASVDIYRAAIQKLDNISRHNFNTCETFV